MASKYDGHRRAVESAIAAGEPAAHVADRLGLNRSGLSAALARWRAEAQAPPAAADEDDRPWWHYPDRLREQLAQHGSCQMISRAVEGAPTAPTLQYWCRKHGIPLTRRPGRSYRPATGTAGEPAVDALARAKSLTGDDLVRMVDALGKRTAAAALGCGLDELQAIAEARGVSLPERSFKSPRLAAAERKIKDLEQRDEGTRELREAITLAAGSLLDLEPPEPVVTARPGGPRRATPVDLHFHVSDIQYGEVVHGSDVPGGDYSPAVFADERLPRWTEAAVELIEDAADAHPLGWVWLLLGGDLVEGHDVFKGQPWHLAMDAGAQVVSLAGLLAPRLAQVAGVAKAHGAEGVVIATVVGNHGVHGGRSAGAVPATLNYDHLTHELIRQTLGGMTNAGDVDYYHPGAHRALYFQSQGHVCLMTHGDQDRGGGLVGVPVVTGLRNDLMVRVSTGLNHRYHYSGHFHKPHTMRVGGDSERIWNGDWCGANNLSVGRGGGSEPTQYAYVLHRLGMLSRHPIYLAPGSSRTPPPVLDPVGLATV
jgi:hypothetical protein